MLVKEVRGKHFDGQLVASDAIRMNIRENKASCSKSKETEGVSASGAGTTHLNRLVESGNVDLMPLSLSQVDISVLQHLPEDLRADIVGALPPHRRSNYLAERNIPVEGVEEKLVSEHNESMVFAEISNFWEGNPPYWVHAFQKSNCLMLNTMADMYLKSETGLLSSTLQCCLSGMQLIGEVIEDLTEEASGSLCELLRQYIQLKLEIDIEEIYVCFRLLKRLTKKFKGFLHVYDAVLPHLQACVGDMYGGNIHLPSMQ